MFKKIAIIFIYYCAIISQCVHMKLQEKFSWKQLEFEWPNNNNNNGAETITEEAAIKSGQYIKEHNLPLGIDRWHNKLFITVPRWKSGVAATLNYVDLNGTEQSPKLKPYPNWMANTIPSEHDQLKNNSTIISIFRIQVDACDRLWAVDTGLADILGDAKQIKPNAIVIFDLKTDQLLNRYVIPEEQVKEDSFFANIIVDTDATNCDQAYAYVPDLGAYGVIVYSLMKDHSYRVKHNFFHFDPLQGDFNVGGVNFQWTDGVFAMAVGPNLPDNSRDIYFHALASTKEFKVSNRVLQNESYVTSPRAYYDFQYVGDRGMNGQSTTEVYDKDTGIIFYTQLNKDAIACWNINKPYNPDTQGLIDSNSHTLIFPNDLKIDTDGNLWALSDKLSNYMYQGLDSNQINYRILTGKNHDLIKGTVCQ